MKYLLLVLLMTGCSLRPCKQYDVVETLGQCSYSSVANYGGSSTCVALTKTGIRVTDSQPFVVGQNVCIDR